MPNTKVQPPPFQALLITEKDYMNDSWAKWIREVFQKVKELETENAALRAQVIVLSGGAWP